MRIVITPSVQAIPKARGAMLLRSSVALDGYRATGTAKDRWDRTLTPDAASAFAAVLSDPTALAAALAAGFVDIAVEGHAGPGKPPASGPSLASLLPAPAASDEAPKATGTTRKRNAR
jgi:hypothetical protein